MAKGKRRFNAKKGLERTLRAPPVIQVQCDTKQEKVSFILFQEKCNG